MRVGGINTTTSQQTTGKWEERCKEQEVVASGKLVAPREEERGMEKEDGCASAALGKVLLDK